MSHKRAGGAGGKEVRKRTRNKQNKTHNRISRDPIEFRGLARRVIPAWMSPWDREDIEQQVMLEALEGTLEADHVAVRVGALARESSRSRWETITLDGGRAKGDRDGMPLDKFLVRPKERLSKFPRLTTCSWLGQPGTCAWCGEEFHQRYRHKVMRFCSVTCANRKNWLTRKINKDQLASRECLGCGSMFRPRPNEAPSVWVKRTFCSHPCFVERHLRRRNLRKSWLTGREYLAVLEMAKTLGRPL